MQILVTGARGMLGTDVCHLLFQSYTVTGIDVQDIDITSIESIYKYLKYRKYDIIIHCAAYTDVDGCEKEPDRAYRINDTGTSNIAQYAQQTNAVLLYLSTDFVFDGEKNEPYQELDTPNPVNIYGKSKLAGEQAVTRQLMQYYIVRTSWLFGKHGKNFVDTILRKAKSGEQLHVVNDQYGSPTYTIDLAEAILKIIQSKKYGVYHITNSGICSWFDFACEIIQLAGLNNTVSVTPIISAELNRLAKRPKYTKLANYRYENEIGPPLRSWQEAVKEYIYSEA